jgi:hypothetical protein
MRGCANTASPFSILEHFLAPKKIHLEWPQLQQNTVFTFRHTPFVFTLTLNRADAPIRLSPGVQAFGVFSSEGPGWPRFS